MLSLLIWYSLMIAAVAKVVVSVSRLRVMGVGGAVLGDYLVYVYYEC